MMITVSGRYLAVIAALGLAACATPREPDNDQPSICRPDAARALVGQAVPADGAVLRQVGGTIVRRIAPGDATTKDFREDRITLTVTDGQIVAAACG